MATLLFENGPDRGSGVELVPGRTYSIGRDPRCDVVVRDGLAYVNDNHSGLWIIRMGPPPKKPGTLVP